jgi:hypothetical protein
MTQPLDTLEELSRRIDDLYGALLMMRLKLDEKKTSHKQNGKNGK